MKTRTLLSLVTVTFGLAAVGAYATLTHGRAEVGGTTLKPAATAAMPAEIEPSARVNVKSLAKHLEFLGDTPSLTGRPVLIEFWATWCPPCRASIKHLNDLDKKYHDRGLEIVGVTGEDNTVVERFRARTPMHYAVALDRDQALATEFQVQTIPQAWLSKTAG